MPASVSYIKLTGKSLIQVRVFINRKKVLLNNTVAINDRSLIKLSSINLLRLSNNDLTKLINDIRDQLVEFLFHEPLEQIFPGRSANKLSKTTREMGQNWKCNVVVSLGYIANLRFRLGYLRNGQDLEFIELHKVPVAYKDSSKTALLEKDLKFVSQDEEDNKKSFSYTLNRLDLLNNSVVDGLDVYVQRRPTSTAERR